MHYYYHSHISMLNQNMFVSDNTCYDPRHDNPPQDQFTKQYYPGNDTYLSIKHETIEKQKRKLQIPMVTLHNK